MRRTIARRLTEAWQAPAFYLTVDVDMDQSNTLRRKLVDTMGKDDVKPTVSDVITKACAVALRRHPDMNVHFAGDALIRFSAVHIGIAVATPQGLVVPVVRDAHARSVREIAEARKVVVDRARDGKLSPAEMEGGTFTISNLGMMGIDEFTAVLNPPMAGILAVGRTKDAVVARNGRPEVRPQMTVTLGCDHRAVDGAVGAAFLATVKAHLEDPMTMI
jgi:pyruvate dehydrogenase E2 component (dihydrolipoamide acetyltransferase)